MGRVQRSAVGTIKSLAPPIVARLTVFVCCLVDYNRLESFYAGQHMDMVGREGLCPPLFCPVGLPSESRQQLLLVQPPVYPDRSDTDPAFLGNRP